MGPFGNLQTDVGVAVGHVDRADVIDGTVPDHREFQRGALETDRIDRVLQIVPLGGRSSSDEPSLVELIATGFCSSGKVPGIVPDFDPGMVTAVVRPQRSADEPCGNCKGSACVDQEDGKSRAGGQPRLHRFVRALIRLGSLGRVLHLDQGKQFLVDHRGGLSRCRCTFDQWSESFAKVLAPGVSSFVDIHIRKDVVEENLLGNLVLPRSLLQSVVGLFDLAQEKIRFETLQVPRRHVRDEELGRLSLRGLNPREDLFKLAAILSGESQSLFDPQSFRFLQSRFLPMNARRTR